MASSGPTLAVLRARVRLTCTNATSWPNATIDAWLGDAIRFYSNEFPRALRHEITLATGTQVYDLPDDCMGVTGVEYPAGEDPPEFLYQADEWSALFQGGGAAYALRGVAAAATVGGALVFAEDVTTGETAIVSYLGQHWVPTGDSELTSVPDAHSEALIAFVEFRSHWELETDEAVSVSSVSVVLSQLGEEARRAWNRYKEVMDRLQWLARAGGSGRVVWGDVGL
jgi:hypothetical protein